MWTIAIALLLAGLWYATWRSGRAWARVLTVSVALAIYWTALPASYVAWRMAMDGRPASTDSIPYSGTAPDRAWYVTGVTVMREAVNTQASYGRNARLLSLAAIVLVALAPTRRTQPSAV
jgi:hypothetical protein